MDNIIRYKMTIGEKTYTIIGNESKEHMQVVEQIVQTQLTVLLALSDDITIEQASILLAVNAISDQVNFKEQMLQMEQYCHTLEKKIQRMEHVEQKAKEILCKKGDHDEPIDHVTAYNVLNEDIKERLQKERTSIETQEKE